ncbi:MAG: L-lactate dehydrogenase (quinone) large subunit LdhH [Bacillota bacterium]
MDCSRDLAAEARRALADPQLSAALHRFSEAYLPAREEALAGVAFEALADRISAIRQHNISRIRQLADMFEQRARASGANVYRAPDASSAVEYVHKLALERGICTVVKSKSMISEEIGLNPVLARAGIQVTETDLGEWIIQLAGQRPSHMVMPAIHMTRKEVARLFSDHLKTSVGNEISELVAVARRELRNRFLEADMGISGANAAVASTGSVMLLTNEGNGRLITTLPPVHVVLVGYEKLVADIDELVPLLQVLPRSATAQRITSYVSIITGPTEVETCNGRKPKELHIVLIDNGRLKMSEHPVFREAMKCIRCSACLNVCPVYRLIGGQVYGEVYSGGIGSVLTAFFQSKEDGARIGEFCLGCRRCVQYCPAKVDIPRLVLALREEQVAARGLPATTNFILRKVLPDRRLLHGLLRVVSRMQAPVTTRRGFIRHLPLVFDEVSRGMSLPALARQPFRDRFEPGEAGSDTVAVFAGCLVDFVYPEIGEAMASVLRRLGLCVTFPEAQSCCGIPAHYLGDREMLCIMAAQNVRALAAEEPHWIVTACPTCAVALKTLYPEVLSLDAELAPMAETVSARTWDFASLAHRLIGRDLEPVADGAPATYHDSCHMKRSLGVTDEPREVLRALGYRLHEMKESDVCCGFGGSYLLKHPGISYRIMRRKLDCIKQTGAGTVFVDCPGCLLQIRGGLERAGIRLEVQHTAQALVASAGASKYDKDQVGQRIRGV